MSRRHLRHRDSSVPAVPLRLAQSTLGQPSLASPGQRRLIPQPRRGSRAVHPPLIIPALSNAVRLRQQHFCLSSSLGLEAAWLRLHMFGGGPAPAGCKRQKVTTAARKDEGGTRDSRPIYHPQTQLLFLYYRQENIICELIHIPLCPVF